MNFNKYLERSNIHSLQNYIKHGGETFEHTPPKTYTQIINDAERDALKFFSDRFPKIEDYDEITGYYYKLTETYEEVFFEIGAIVGAKLAFELKDKINELL